MRATEGNFHVNVLAMKMMDRSEVANQELRVVLIGVRSSGAVSAFIRSLPAACSDHYIFFLFLLPLFQIDFRRQFHRAGLVEADACLPSTNARIALFT